MQLFVHAQELHTLKVTTQEMVAQIKAHVASLKGIVPENQVMLLASTPLEDEATLGQ
jgi:small subunit ribosomal protein S30e